MYEFIITAIGIWIILSVPVALPWGWVRWWRRNRTRDLFSIFSFTGFTFASVSALLGVSAAIYAKVIGGFLFDDPTLFQIYRYGALISISGIAFGIAGLWRPSALRWHAPVCALGTLLFWFIQASNE